MIWSDDCPTHFRGVSRPISLGAIRVGSSLDSRSDRPLISAGLEAGEQVVGAGAPRRRVAAAALGLVEPRDFLIPGREGGRVLRSGNPSDGPKVVGLRP